MVAYVGRMGRVVVGLWLVFFVADVFDGTR
jgi:hypothetical protein